MKRLFLLAIWMLLAASTASAADIYFASVSAGANNGTSCANAYAYNDATNGINKVVNWVPGNKLHVCGTITFGLNTSGIIAQASGTSVNPITVLFEAGAIIQSPAFSGCTDGPGSGGNTAGGGIQVNGFNYIVIDGGLTGSNGPNGIIQNTANGTNLANQQCSVGIWENGDFNIVRNIRVLTIYVQDPTSASTAAASSGGLLQNSVNYSKVCNSEFANSGLGVELNYADTVYTPPTTLPNCQSNTFTLHELSFFNNTLHDHPWQLHSLNGTGAPLCYNNEIYDWANWTLTPIHTHGIFVTGHGSTVFFPQIFNNYIHGDLAGSSPTGMIYLTDDGAVNSGYGQSANLYGNVLYGQGSSVTCCQGLASQQTSGDPKGPYKFYNNTIVNTGSMMINYLTSSATTTDWRNNIWYGQSVSYFYQANSGLYSFALATFNGSVYFGGRALPFGLYQSLSNFSTWKTNCVNGGGTGCDSASVTTDPLLAGEASFNAGTNLTGAGFYLLSTSNARAIGTNLNSQCAALAGLCTSAPQTFGAGGSCGTGCATRPAAGAWDAGAYQYAVVDTPTFSPIAGTYTSAQNVTISTTTSGSTLCYTTDGSTPTANGAGTCTHGTTYSTPVAVPASITIKAVGSHAGNTDSAVATAAYSIITPPATSPAPVMITKLLR